MPDNTINYNFEKVLVELIGSSGHLVIGNDKKPKFPCHNWQDPEAQLSPTDALAALDQWGGTVRGIAMIVGHTHAVIDIDPLTAEHEKEWDRYCLAREEVEQTRASILKSSRAKTYVEESHSRGHHAVFRVSRSFIGRRAARILKTVFAIDFLHGSRYCHITAKGHNGLAAIDGTDVLAELFDKLERAYPEPTVHGATGEIGVDWLPDGVVWQVLSLQRPDSYAKAEFDGECDFSGAVTKVIGDLAKISNDPRQVQQMIARTPLVRSPHQCEGGRTDRSAKYQKLFDHWWQEARESNLAGLPLITRNATEYLPSIEHGAMMLQGFEAAFAREKVVTPNPVGYNEPVDYWAMVSPAPVPKGVFPRVLEELALEVGKSTGLDPAGLIALSMGVCAMATTDKLRVSPTGNPTWLERACIWAVAVGKSGIGKSPLVRTIEPPIKELDSDIYRVWEARCATLRTQAEQAGQKFNPPPCPDILLGDTTTEAAQDAMSANPNGVGIISDEITDYLAGIDRYNPQKGASPNRPFWLKSYDGLADRVRRIGRGRIHIDNISLSIAGCIQNTIIKKIGDHDQQDGMLQRLTTVILVEQTKGTNADISRVLAAYSAMVKQLHKLSGYDVSGGTRQEGARLRLDAGAQVIFDKASDDVKKLRTAIESTYPGMNMHLSKYPGMLARLALMFHLIDLASMPRKEDPPAGWISDVIPESVMKRAYSALFEFFIHHAFVFHGEILGMGGDDVLEQTAGFILAHKIEVVELRMLQRSITSCRNMKHHEYDALMRKLHADDWLLDIVDGPRRDSPKRGMVNPQVHVVFQQKAIEERERRDEVHRLAAGVRYKEKQE